MILDLENKIYFYQFGDQILGFNSPQDQIFGIEASGISNTTISGNYNFTSGYTLTSSGSIFENISGNTSGYIYKDSDNSGLFTGYISGYASGYTFVTISGQNYISGYIIEIISGSSGVTSGVTSGVIFGTTLIEHVSGYTSSYVSGVISGYINNSGLFSGYTSGNTLGNVSGNNFWGNISGYAYGNISGYIQNLSQLPDEFISELISGHFSGEASGIISGATSGATSGSGIISGSVSSFNFSDTPITSGIISGTTSSQQFIGDTIKNLIDFYNNRGTEIDDNYWFYYYDLLNLNQAGLGFLYYDLKDLLMTGSLNILNKIIEETTSGVSGFAVDINYYDLNNTGEQTGLNATYSGRLSGQEIMLNIFAKLTGVVFGNIISSGAPNNTNNFVSPFLPYNVNNFFDTANANVLGISNAFFDPIEWEDICGAQYVQKFPKNPIAVWTFPASGIQIGYYNVEIIDGKPTMQSFTRPYWISKTYLGDYMGKYFLKPVHEDKLFISSPNEISKIEPGYYYETLNNPVCLNKNSAYYSYNTNWTQGAKYNLFNIKQNDNVYAIPGAPVIDAVIKNKNQAIGDIQNTWFTSVDWLDLSDSFVFPPKPQFDSKDINTSLNSRGIRLWNNLISYNYNQFDDFMIKSSGQNAGTQPGTGQGVPSLTPHRYKQSPKRLSLKQNIFNDSDKIQENREISMSFWVRKNTDYSDEYGISVTDYNKQLSLENNRGVIEEDRNAAIESMMRHSPDGHKRVNCPWNFETNSHECFFYKEGIDENCNGIDDNPGYLVGARSGSDAQKKLVTYPYQRVSFSSYPYFPGAAAFTPTYDSIGYARGFSSIYAISGRSLTTKEIWSHLEIGSPYSTGITGIITGTVNHPDYYAKVYAISSGSLARIVVPPKSGLYGYLYEGVPYNTPIGTDPYNFLFGTGEFRYQPIHTGVYTIPPGREREIYLYFDFGGGTFEEIQGEDFMPKWGSAFTGFEPYANYSLGWGNAFILGESGLSGKLVGGLTFQKAFSFIDAWPDWAENALLGDVIGPTGLGDLNGNCKIAEIYYYDTGTATQYKQNIYNNGTHQDEVQGDRYAIYCTCGPISSGQFVKNKLKIIKEVDNSKETLFDDYFENIGIMPVKFEPAYDRKITIIVNEGNKVPNHVSSHIEFGPLSEHNRTYGWKDPRKLSPNWAYHIGEVHGTTIGAIIKGMNADNVSGQSNSETAFFAPSVMQNIAIAKTRNQSVLNLQSWNKVDESYNEKLTEWNIYNEYPSMLNDMVSKVALPYAAANPKHFDLFKGEFIEKPGGETINYILGTRTLEDDKGLQFFEYKTGYSSGNPSINTGQQTVSYFPESGVGISFGGHVKYFPNLNLKDNEWNNFILIYESVTGSGITGIVSYESYQGYEKNVANCAQQFDRWDNWKQDEIHGGLYQITGEYLNIYHNGKKIYKSENFIEVAEDGLSQIDHGFQPLDKFIYHADNFVINGTSKTENRSGIYLDNITCNTGENSLGNIKYEGGNDYAFHQLAFWDRTLEDCEASSLYNDGIGMKVTNSSFKCYSFAENAICEPYRLINVKKLGIENPTLGMGGSFYVKWFNYYFLVTPINREKYSFNLNEPYVRKRKRQGCDYGFGLSPATNAPIRLNNPIFCIEYNHFNSNWRVRQLGTNIVVLNSVPVAESQYLPTKQYTSPLEESITCTGSLDHPLSLIRNNIIGAKYQYVHWGTRYDGPYPIYKDNNFAQSSRVCVSASQTNHAAFGLENENAVYFSFSPGQGTSDDFRTAGGSRTQKIVSPHGENQFGASVALSANSLSLAIGAPRAKKDDKYCGAVYIYNRNNLYDSFKLKQVIYGENNNDRFGTSVAFNYSKSEFDSLYQQQKFGYGDNLEIDRMLFVGAPGEGSRDCMPGYVKYFDFAPTGTTSIGSMLNGYVEIQKIQQPPGSNILNFGSNITVSEDGSDVYVISPNQPFTSATVNNEWVTSAYGGYTRIAKYTKPANPGAFYKYFRTIDGFRMLPFSSGFKYVPNFYTGIYGSYRFYTGVHSKQFSGSLLDSSIIYSNTYNYSGAFSGLPEELYALKQSPTIFNAFYENPEYSGSGYFPVDYTEPAKIFNNNSFKTLSGNTYVLDIEALSGASEELASVVLNSKDFIVSGITGNYNFYTGIVGFFNIDLQLLNSGTNIFPSYTIGKFKYDLEYAASPTYGYNSNPANGLNQLGYGHAAAAFSNVNGSLYINIIDGPGSVIRIDTDNANQAPYTDDLSVPFSTNLNSYVSLAGTNMFEKFGQSMKIRSFHQDDARLIIGKSKTTEEGSFADTYTIRKIGGISSYSLSDKYSLPDSKYIGSEANQNRYNKISELSSAASDVDIGGNSAFIGIALDPTGGYQSNFELKFVTQGIWDF